MVRPTFFQPHGQPIDIETWRADEDFPIHPLGSKPKRVVTCPEIAAFKCVRGTTLTVNDGTDPNIDNNLATIVP